MKKLLIIIFFVLFLVITLFAIKQTESVNRVSVHIVQSIGGNVNQLCSFYDGMYTDESPNNFFESSILTMEKCCDSIKEEISLWYSVYPKKALFLENITDDYKLVLRMLRERERTEELVSLHGQIHDYIEKYNKGTDSEDYVEAFYKKDKEIKENDYDYKLLHMNITKKLHGE